MPGTKIPSEIPVKIPAGQDELTLLKKKITEAGQAAIAPSGKFPSEKVPGGKVPVQKANIQEKPPVTNLNTQAPNSPAPAASSGGAAESSNNTALPARLYFAAAAAAMGFPPDTLSTTLMAFMRFFSLPPAMLGKLRRDLLNNIKTSSPVSAGEKTALEAAALAAAAALDKGVKLSPEALERYAQYFKHVGAVEFSGDDDLLDLMNYFSGNSDQSWMVFPFEINMEGIELSVILRVLKKGLDPGGDNAAPKEGECLIIDVKSSKRNWRFIVRSTGKKLKADIFINPSVSEKSLKFLANKAKAFFGDLEIRVFNAENDDKEIFSWMELFNEPLPMVDKEV